MLPRPGDLTVTFMGEAIDMYEVCPTNDNIAGIPRRRISGADGMLFVIGRMGSWCCVLTSSQKFGWVYKYDVAANSQVAGSVYHI